MVTDTVLFVRLSSIVTFPLVSQFLYGNPVVVSTKSSHSLSLMRHQAFCCW